MCSECWAINEADLKNNKEASMRHMRGEISKEQCLALHRHRIKEMYYSQPQTATGGEGQN